MFFETIAFFYRRRNKIGSCNSPNMYVSILCSYIIKKNYTQKIDFNYVFNHGIKGKISSLKILLFMIL